MSTARSLTLVVAILALTACSDGPMAPRESIDQVAADRVMPSVIDARVRLATNVENAAIQERVRHDLRELESALTSRDAQKTRFHVRILSKVLTDYRMEQGSVRNDGADITAIALMLHAVSEVVDAGFDLALFQ